MQNKKRKKISLVIPCYFEEQSILSFFADIHRTIQTIDTYTFEILYINDGSKDATRSHIQELWKQYAWVKWISFSRNFGKEIALSAWLAYAQGDAVVTLDGDGQHPIEKLALFIKQREQWYNIVYNERPNTWGIHMVRKWTSRIYYTLSRLLWSTMHHNGTDYRLLDRCVVDAYLSFHEHNRMYRSLLDWMEFKNIGISFDAKERLDNTWSRFTIRMLIRLAIDWILWFSKQPIHMVWRLWCTALLIGVVCIVPAMIFEQPIHGSAPTIRINSVTIPAIQTWILLLGMRILWIYIGRIHDDTTWRPLYIVEETVNIEKDIA